MPGQPKPSGTVVVLRDAGDLEILLLQRAPRQGKPGPWVFPGGKVEAGDRREGARPVDDARRASVRETREEAGLELAPEHLVSISRWITPEIAPRRFDAWFFLAQAQPDAPVRVDGGEIQGHRWLAPDRALEAHHRRELRLAPPTFVTVSWLAGFGDCASALRTWEGRDPIAFHPRITRTDQGACMLYPGDAGYEAGDPERRGPRHRLWAREERWLYEWDELPGGGR